MKTIKIEEHKKILLDILKYLDKVCRDNNIKYSLCGGSLIGAVREHGIIPWDDDIDVILTKSEYEKLIKTLKKVKNSKFKILTYKLNNTYYYPFAKIVDNETILEEKDCKKIENYGIYIDIFTYNNLPENKILKKIHCSFIRFFMKLIQSSYYINISKDKKFYYLRKIKNKICNFIGHKRLLKIYTFICNFYNNKKSKECISNWPIYNMKNEIQKKSDTIKYIDIDFNGINVMIFENYDNILKKTFGDYMELPPKEERKAKHDSKIYWR